MSDESYKEKQCRYCETELPEPFLELGAMALANSYVAPEDAGGEEFTCPLSLTHCPKCFLIQLSHVVPPEKMFSHYLYVSSTTKTFQDHFANYAKAVKSRLVAKEKPLALDIGSNDGLLVSCYDAEGMQGIGVDPATNLAEAANEQGRKTINRYFDAETVQMIKEEYGPAHVISGNNVFAHIGDSASVLKNAYDLLDREGILVFEFPYLPVMVEKLLFDMIYHEHLSYIGVNALQSVLSRFNFHVFDLELVPSHGGSLRAYIQKNDGPYEMRDAVVKLVNEEREKGYLSFEIYETFAKNVNQIKADFMQVITELKKEGKRIAGYGAPAKASTICNFYGLGKEDIEYVVDDNPLKQNLLMPGSQLPIVSSEKLQESPPDYLIIFAWNFATEILKKIDMLQEKGVRFLLPVPNPEVDTVNLTGIQQFEVGKTIHS